MSDYRQLRREALNAAMDAIDRDCLSAGYPSSRASIWRGDYCIKRVDQTDVVTPFDDRKKVQP